MNHSSEARLKEWARRVAQTCGIAVATLATLAWLSWGIGELRHFTLASEYLPMAPSTALVAILLGAALFAPSRWPAHPGARNLGLAAAVISIFFSLLALARAAFGWNWTPDLWLRGNLVTAVVLPPGVMSILTATALLLLAGALLLQLPPLERQRHAPGIGAGLAVLVLGIGLTNFLGYAAGTPFVFAGQRIQMAFLTAVCLMLFGTGVLLNGPAASWCVALLAGEVPAATGTHRRWFQRSTYVLFLPVLTLSVAVVAVGVIFLRHRQSATRESAGVMLSAIAEAKVAQIVQWRRERLEDAETALAYSTIVRRYVRLASRPADGTVPGFVRRELKAWQQHSQYARVRLLSPDGTVRFAPPPGGQVVEPSLAPLIAQSSRSDRILLSDLYATPALPSGAAMAMVVPLRLEAEQAGADELSVGAMLFEIDPASFLFPFVQAWPLRGRTAEAILFRLEAEEGLVLNPLRQQPEAALKLRLSLNRLNMLGDPEEGDAVEGIDHRGVAVLTTMRRVPGSPWFLLCKVDLAEIYAPLRFGAMITALLVGLLWLAGVIAAGLLWRQQRVRLLQHSLAQEREQLALAERVVHLTKHANDAILLTDGEWRLLEANDRALQLYGFSLEEIRRLTLSHLLAPGAREDFGRKIDQLAATGGAIIESLHRRKDESTFPVENSVRAIDLGGVRFHQCIVRDVSERQQAEHALRQSRALLQAVIEGTSDAIYVKDVAGRYLLFNSAAARFLGNPDGEIAGQTDLALFPPADARRMMEADRGVLESDRLQTLEEEVTLDGKPHVFLSTKGPLRDAEGRVTGLFGIARDITALKQSARQTAELLRETERARAALLGILEDQRAAEEALRMSEERFRIIFEQAPLGVALIDSLTGRFLALNSRYAQIAGRTVEELLARDWMAITHPDDIRPEQESMEAMLSGRTTGFSTEQRFVRGGGIESWVNLTVAPLSVGQGGKKLHLAMVEDIAERKRAEAVRIELAKDLERKNRELESLIFVTSHDLRSPLLNVQGFSRRIEEHCTELKRLLVIEHRSPAEREAFAALVTQKVPRSLSFILSSVEKMDQLILGLLRLSRLGRVGLNVEVLDMEPLLRKILAAMAYQIQSTGAVIELGELPPCRGDAGLISQLFSNLLDNALKYRSPSRPPRVTITGRLDEGRAWYSVADNGVGIEPRHREKVWEVFFRGNPRGPVAGDGLGLNLVQRIVERHHGEIRLESQPGVGSTFLVALPRPGRDPGGNTTAGAGGRGSEAGDRRPDGGAHRAAS